MEPYYFFKEEKFMKIGKRILCFLLAVIMTCSIGLAGNSMEAEAATKVSITKYIRCGVGMRHNISTDVYMPGKDDNIKNIKVYKGKKTTKNLVVKQTSRSKNTGTYDNYGSVARLTMYAKKKGTYKIKFDVYKSKTTKRSSHTITVRARGNTDSALDSVTIDGKKVYDVNKNSAFTFFCYTTATSGKVKFTLDDGCKIKNITMRTYKRDSNPVNKKFKNGSKAAFGKYGQDSSNSTSWNKSMWGRTEFEIEYTDENNKGAVDKAAFYILRYK